MFLAIHVDASSIQLLLLRVRKIELLSYESVNVTKNV